MIITGSPKLNLTLYSLLMIFTPFLLLQNYLQEAIGALSDISFSVGSAEIPIFLFLVVIAALFSVYLLIRHFSWGRITGILLVALLLSIGYLTSDYYFNQYFYDIQHNWHYFAYGIYSWLAWQVFELGVRNHQNPAMPYYKALFDEYITSLSNEKEQTARDILELMDTGTEIAAQ